jgi:hypothetical protein
VKKISSTSTHGAPLSPFDDAGAIHALDRTETPESRFGGALSSQAHTASVPTIGLPSRQLQALTDLLGKNVTVGNVAWTAAALPDMRALQKRLVEHSLKQGKEDRADCLAAILVVEDAVKLRLRLQQMYENEAELAMATEESESKK